MGGPDPGAVEVSLQAERALGEVRRIKAMFKKPAKAPMQRAVLPVSFQPMRPAIRDFQAAAHVRLVDFADVTDVELEPDSGPLGAGRAT